MDIFYGQCLNNHMLPICLSEEEVEELPMGKGNCCTNPRRFRSDDGHCRG